MCHFCFLKIPAHSPLAQNTQIGALYNLFHFMHDKITQTEIIFRNNEPLILQNRTCLLEYDFIYCGTNIIFLWGRGCHMNAGRLVWLVCTNSPLSLLGVSDASAVVHGLHARSSTLQRGYNLASLQLSGLSYIHFPCFVQNLGISRFLWCDTVGAVSHRIVWSFRVFLKENRIYEVTQDI